MSKLTELFKIFAKTHMKQKCTHLLSREPKLRGITGLRVLSRSSIFNLLRDLARVPAPCNSCITTDHREFSGPITLKETTGQTVAEELLGKIAFDYSKKLSLKTMPCMKYQAILRQNKRSPGAMGHKVLGPVSQFTVIS